MLDYIRDERTPKEAWENQKKIFAASITTRKLQLKQELKNIRQKDTSVADYTSKTKDIYHVVGSINVMVEEEEMVQIYCSRRSSVQEKSHPPSSAYTIHVVGKETHARGKEEYIL